MVAAAASRAIGPAGFLAEGITGFHLPAGRFKNHFQQTYNSWSGYLQTKSRLTRRLTLLAGARYNYDDKSLTNAIAQLQGGDGVPIAPSVC